MNSKNVFSALGKYNSANDENYLTEAFVFVINALLDTNRPLAIDILTKLCVNDADFSFSLNEVISVTTQESTEYGVPDIKVSSPNKLIYIEVKHDSVFDPEQIKRYQKALYVSSAPTKHVIALTRFAIDLDEQPEELYKHVRWFEVYNWLTNIKTANLVNQYLIDSFKSFLEEKQMGIQKVGWEYINGVPALNNIINMIETGIQGAGLKVYAKYYGWEAKGFYIESKEFWCGFGLYEHLFVSFDIQRPYLKKYNTKLLKTPSYPLEEDKDAISFSLDLEEIHFFSLTKDEQLDEITKFIKTCYKESQEMKVK